MHKARNYPYTVGRKRWLFLPPGEEKKVELTPGTFLYDLLSEEALHLQASPHPVRKKLYYIFVKFGIKLNTHHQ